MSRCPRLPFAALALALLAAVAAPAGAADEAPLTLDFTQAHPYAGLGAQLWLQPPQPAATQMLRDMNAQFIRISPTPKFLADDVQPGMTLAQVEQALAAAETPAHLQRLAELRELVASLHLRVHLVFWHMPEAWEDSAQKKAASKKSSHYARSDRIDDWARVVTASILQLEKHGIDPAAVELTNEPHGAWDVQYTPEQYADLVLAARHTLDAAGLQRVRIDGPGVGLRNFDDFLRGLEAKHATASLGFVTGHAYQPPEQMADPATPGYASFLGRGRYGPVYITEFGVKKHNGGPDDAVAAHDLDLESPRYAVAASAEALMLLGHGASAIFYWQLQDRETSKKEHGLLDPAGRKRPVALAVQALFGHAPAGGLTVAATGGDPLVPVEGVLVDGQVHLMMANLTDTPRPIVARFAGLLAPRRAVGGEDGFLEQGGRGPALEGVALKDGVFRATLAPHAVAAVLLTSP